MDELTFCRFLLGGCFVLAAMAIIAVSMYKR